MPFDVMKASRMFTVFEYFHVYQPILHQFSFFPFSSVSRFSTGGFPGFVTLGKTGVVHELHLLICLLLTQLCQGREQTGAGNMTLFQQEEAG